MDIPAKFRSKMGVYDIQINGDKIKATRGGASLEPGVTPKKILDSPLKATLVNQEHMIENVISELKSLVDSNSPIVGVDFKRSELSKKRMHMHLLLLYVKDHCFVIQLDQINHFPKNLGNFLGDKSICFVGFKIDDNFDQLRHSLEQKSSSSSFVSADDDESSTTCLTGDGAEIRMLAASVLKKPSLTKCCDPAQLAREIGFEMEKPDETTVQPSYWGALCFSEEEMKYALRDVYICYHIGKRMLGML
ncbi:hypothetical protein OROHE_008423 [Orobanche hederae]